MSEKQTPRLPVVGEYVRSHGTLVAIEEVLPPPQPPPQTDYIFEEITAHGELRRNGDVLRELDSFNDFYGLGTGVETCISEMWRYAKKHDIGPASEVEVVVVKIVSRFRAQPIAAKNYYDPAFVNFAPLQSGARWNLPDRVETVVWSTKGLPK